MFWTGCTYSFSFMLIIIYSNKVRYPFRLGQLLVEKFPVTLHNDLCASLLADDPCFQAFVGLSCWDFWRQYCRLCLL
jgi:hypothetical protein